MYERIIWATDGSEGADAALAEVKKLAVEGGRIIAVHCVEFLTGRAMGLPTDPEEPEHAARIREQIADLRAEGFDVSLVTHRVHTSPADTISAVAEEEHADLIVCGTRGMSALAGALMGSVSQRLLHAAHVPVLVVPEPHPAVLVEETPKKEVAGV